MERIRLSIACLLVCLLGSTGGLFRHHKVEPHRTTAPLKSATQPELVARIGELSAAIQTMNATVDIDTTAGGEKSGQVTEFQEIRGYILIQQPRQIRMIGLLPIVRTTAFDMLSDGDHFQLLIPPKSRLITGPNQSSVVSKNPLENLRPHIVHDALLVPPIDPENEIAVLEEGYQQVRDEHRQLVDQPNYHLLVIHRYGLQWRLDRKIYFSRADLEPYRQTTYDEHGAVASDVTYSDRQEFSGLRFPALIEIERPQEEYRIVLKMIKLSLNQPLTAEQFKMEVPSGTAITELK